MLIVIMLSVIMLIVVMLSVIMRNAVMLSVALLNVVVSAFLQNLSYEKVTLSLRLC
jgi:hypothetical protein